MAESKCKIRRVFFTSPKACRPAWLRPRPLQRPRNRIQNRSVAPASCRRSRGRLALGTAGRACPELVERTLAPPELLRHRLCGGGAEPRYHTSWHVCSRGFASMQACRRIFSNNFGPRSTAGGASRHGPEARSARVPFCCGSCGDLCASRLLRSAGNAMATWITTGSSGSTPPAVR